MDASGEATDRQGSVRTTLPASPPSVAEARRLVRQLLEARGRSDLEDTATLLVSEVVTNALLHAGTHIDVVALVDGDRLVVEVGDGSPHVPVPRSYGATAGTGRGLRMLDQLVDDWGVRRRDGGKTVWFTLSQPERSSPGSGFAGVDGEDHDEDGQELVQVRLLRMPLLLHAAWREHAEALLRELLLAQLDDEDPEDPTAIAMHADATDALAILEEHVPDVDVGTDPAHLMADATEPRVSADQVVVPVPVESIGSFETLERAILSALEIAQTGATLTPPTQPELQQFRRWLCEQVEVQAVGGAPAPWVGTLSTETPRRLRPPADWDTASVAEASTCRIAADEANAIVAVSGSAARLLGYDDPAELVGRRLVSIIPDRYRQAHVAGFTLHQLTGRSPLLGRPVTVPALRKDGSELEIRLLVHDERCRDGRSVFVADLDCDAEA